MAAQLNHASVCKLLVEHGCNINHRDGQNRLGSNYILIICFRTFLPTLQFGYINLPNASIVFAEFRTALMVAAEFGNKEVCEILVRRGANTLFADDHGIASFICCFFLLMFHLNTINF